MNPPVASNVYRDRTLGMGAKALGLPALVAFLIIFSVLADGYALHLAILSGVAVILASSLNLLAGYAGRLSLGHAAFYGIGAYASTLVSQKLGLPVLFSMALAGPITALVALIVGPVMLR